jgi:hypothetical protein
MALLEVKPKMRLLVFSMQVMLRCLLIPTSLIAVTAASQVALRLGPLEVTVPKQYSATVERKSTRLDFTIASPRLTVSLLYATRQGSDNPWTQLDAIAQERHKGTAEVKRTQWLGLPAVLYRIDEKKGSTTTYRLVLTALDDARDTVLQLEIAFPPSEAGAVQKALERWTAAVRYSAGGG